jgi:hypothetical protein
LALAATWVGVFALTWWLLLARLVVVRDEAWMLWLATRLSRGDVLYRDAYDVTTPIAAWLAAAVVRVAGPQMAAVRALAAAVFATQVVLGIVIVRRAGSRAAGQAVLALVLLAVAAPYGAFVSVYSALAVCFAMATLLVTLEWLAGAAAGRIAGPAAWGIGVAGGCTFWTKPNVGVLVAFAVAAAALAAMWGQPWRPWIPGLVRIAAGALVVSLACVAMIVLTGAWVPFVDQVFRSKGEYLELGFGYLPALRERYHRLVDGTVPFQLRRVTGVLVQAAPVALLVALAAGAVRSRRAALGPLVAFVAFGVAGMLAVFPRPGLNHITGVMPLVVTAVAGTWALGHHPGRAPARWARVALVAAGALAVAGIVALAVPLRWPAQPDRFRRDAPHFAWTPVARRQLEASARLRRELRAWRIDTVFIVRKDAGFLYLRTGARNPLPYDIVERSDLGADDEAGVIRRLARGEAEWVCVRKPGSGGTSDAGLVPARLERWIRATLEPVAELARCELYRAGPGVPASRPDRTAPAMAS